MRSLPTTFRAAIEDPNNDDPPLVFLTLSHDDLVEPLRFVWDVVDYILNGRVYIGFPFEITLLSDQEEAPRGQLVVQNIDRKVGAVVQSLSNPVGVAIEIYSASDFDLTVRPRVAIGTPQRAYRADNLYLRNVSGDAMTVSGELTSWDYISQPWPSRYAVESLLPGLFR